MLDSLEGPCLLTEGSENTQQGTILDSLLVNNHTLWKVSRNSTQQLFMASAFSLPECRRRFGFAYAKNYREIMKNFVEKDYHHQKDSVVSLSVQLFTVPSLAMSLVEQLDFLTEVSETIRSVIEPAIIRQTGMVPSSELLESDVVPPFLLERLAETVNDLEYV